MSRRLLCSVVGALITGCASAPPVPPPGIPVEWSQKPEERGTLPVGRVIAIKRWSGPEPGETSSAKQSVGEVLYVTGVIPVLALVTAPVVLAADAVGVVDLQDSDEYESENGNVYRHFIQMNGTNEEMFRDEYFKYQLGDCVAIRTQPNLLVPALPDECP